jgi:glycyl-tRNA synthetase beta chain
VLPGAGRCAAAGSRPRRRCSSASLIAPLVKSHVANEDYADALKVLASVRAEVDRFFDEVMVNVDEPLLRANRLGLLKSLFDQLNAVADISKLGV